MLGNKTKKIASTD
jgi:predicted DNA-binding transcriptional regulator YafY